MHFDFATAGRILFGAGRWSETGPLARSLGTRALLVTGQNRERAAGLEANLMSSGLTVTSLKIAGEPTVADAVSGAHLAREERLQVVVCFGGGSVLDAGKAIAALAPHPGDPLRFLEVIGQGLPLEHDPLPVIAIPTTAGTGSEVTRNAVLGSPEHRVKVSLRSPKMLPRVALVDPSLSLSLPPHLTASTGLDALTQLLEAYVSSRANPMTDLFCREGLTRVPSALLRAYHRGDDLSARSDLALGALYSGLALGNAGLGAVHGLAGPLGGRCPGPHGSLCAALLAPITATNLRALQERQPQHPSLHRYQEALCWMTGRASSKVEELPSLLREWVKTMEIPGLSFWGVTPEGFPDLIRQAQQSSSMKGNPVPLTPLELETALQEAL